MALTNSKLLASSPCCSVVIVDTIPVSNIVTKLIRGDLVLVRYSPKSMIRDILSHNIWRTKKFNDILFATPEYHQYIRRFASKRPILIHGCIIEESEFREEKYCEEFDQISK